MAGIVFSESSNLANSIYGAVQAPIQEIILSKAESIEQRGSIVDKLFKKTSSTHFAENYAELTSMTGFAPTPENGALNIGGMQEGFSKTLHNVTWTNSFRISREMIEDAQAVSMRDRPEAFIDSFYRTRDKFCAALIGSALSGNATFTFGGTGFDAKSADGQCAFYASHPSAVDSSYTQSNVCSNTLSAANLGLVETAMQNLKDDNGESLPIAPNTIVIPNTAAAKAAAFAAAGSYSDPTNDYDAFNYHVGRWNIVVWNTLNDYVDMSNSTPWFLIDTEYSQMFSSLIFQEREALSIDSYEDKNTYANIWRGRARFAAGVKDWRGIYAAGVYGATALT